MTEAYRSAHILRKIIIVAVMEELTLSS